MVERHYDVVCLSHLRWAWVWQRPQHLLSLCAPLGDALERYTEARAAASSAAAWVV